VSITGIEFSGKLKKTGMSRHRGMLMVFNVGIRYKFVKVVGYHERVKTATEHV